MIFLIVKIWEEQLRTSFGSLMQGVHIQHLFISVTVTSSEVKKRLHEFVISKKQKDLAIASLSGAQAFKHWLVKRFFMLKFTK